MRSAVLILCLSVLGCSAGSSPEPESRSAVEAQERLWQEAGVTSYRFEFQQQCFCVREQVQPVIIEVRDQRIERVLSKETGQDLSSETNLQWYTIADLFERIAEAEANGTEPLVVRYDPQLGYPVRIEMGSLAADAGMIFTASDLEPLR